MEQFKFRANVVQGFMHGGGAAWYGKWHSSYQKAKKELATYVAKHSPLYSDSVSLVECEPVKS